MPNWYDTTSATTTWSTDSNTGSSAYAITSIPITWTDDAPIPETATERRQRLAREAAREREQTEVEGQRMLAQERAEVLLRTILGPGYADYEHSGHVDVDSQQHAGRRYRIEPGQFIGVFEGDQRVDRLCIHTRDGCPPADEVVAKLILAQHDEARMLEVAIRHGPSLPAIPPNEPWPRERP